MKAVVFIGALALLCTLALGVVIGFASVVAEATINILGGNS